jgi:hypothetical protein
MIAPRFDEMPGEPLDQPIWLVWRVVERTTKAGKLRKTKPPFNARTGKYAKTNDPDTWVDRAEARAAYERGGWGGVGIRLTQPLVGIDYDGCVLADGSIEPEAQRMIDELGSYTELSPSRTGVRILVTGELPPGRRRKDFLDREHHGIELYDHTSPRFFTLTGHRISGNGVIAERSAELRRIYARLFPPPKPKPEQPKMKLKPTPHVSDQELIDRACAANDNGKFSRLWAGHWEGEYPSQSEADLALCTKLAFWTNHEAGRIDALFRHSGLMREKWDRDDYSTRTITKALELQTESIGAWKPPQSTVTLDAAKVAATVETLNAMPLFAGLQFTAVKRRGHLIVAEFADGSEAVWTTMKDLISFSVSQSLIAESTGIVVATPPRRTLKAVWEPVAQVILRLAGGERVTSAQLLREEFREILFNVWQRAGCPEAKDKAEMVALMQQCVKHARDSKTDVPPVTAVWHDNKKSYVHAPSLIEWLSVPAGKHHRYDTEQVERALRLLDFVPLQVHKSDAKAGNAKVRLWVGSLDVLTEDLTPDAEDAEIEEEL